MIRKDPVTNLKALNEAYDYEKPSGFSRGMKVTTQSKETIYISGTASIDENGNSIHIGDFAAQTRRMYHNTKLLLESENFSWKDVVKTTIYIKNIYSNYDEFNRLRLEFFKSEGIEYYPASTCVSADLCRPELLIEMELIAMK